jgi:hypothetical protein
MIELKEQILEVLKNASDVLSIQEIVTRVHHEDLEVLDSVVISHQIPFSREVVLLNL